MHKCTLDELMRSPEGQAAVRAGRGHDLETDWKCAGERWPDRLDDYRHPTPAEKCVAVSMRIIESWPASEPRKAVLWAQALHRQERERVLQEQYGQREELEI